MSNSAISPLYRPPDNSAESGESPDSSDATSYEINSAGSQKMDHFNDNSTMVASPVPNHINVHMIGQDNSLTWKYTPRPDQGAWSDWHTTDNSKWIFEPVAIAYKPEFFSLFTVSEQHVLYQNNWDLNITGDFTGWKSLGGKLLSPPAVAVRNGTIHIFHLGLDNNLHHLHWDPANGEYTPAVGTFENLGGPFIDTPTA
ncbi:hypothetical protein M422DRAFT_247346, partial [Sphaerobolus stellatus SS14]